MEHDIKRISARSNENGIRNVCKMQRQFTPQWSNGLNGEAGEVIDLLKKHMFQGHELDKGHIAKELGDCLWYIAIAAEGAGYTLDVIADMNVKKLRKRYPDGFEAEKSIHRTENDI